MFRRILIANRGEIAARIVRTCRRLGIESVVTYSEADRGAPWLAEATQAVCIGPARADASYLNAGAILQAAEQTECRAIHPGYGFLSENAPFAARCEQQGITFIGPTPSAIRRMGDKIEAKLTMDAAGVPTIPGSRGAVRDLDDARALAIAAGYPVLLKATAGGGGKGMRRCDDESALARGFEQATLEAEKAFGNPALYLEKYLEGGRHIEFQVLADAFGRAIHLGERECSIQRSHQKLVEESFSPAVDGGARDRFGALSARAAAAIGYRGAGTIEFLRAVDGTLYFMEMNTRLQVEHPVTEMLTGLDLVEQQIRIAALQPLGLRQDEVVFTGHAIELRINAEDPDDGFRPDPGTISALIEPPSAIDGATVRWDSGARAGWRIPPHYDSLIGKLIVHAGDRAGAIMGARQALAALRIEGVKTTCALHARILADSSFVSGDYDVGFVDRRGLAAARR